MVAAVIKMVVDNLWITWEFTCAQHSEKYRGNMELIKSFYLQAQRK